MADTARLLIPFMRVEFEFTKDDLIDASQRFLKRGKLISSGMWTTAIYSGVSVGAVVFLLYRDSPSKGLTIGLVVAGMTVLGYPVLHKKGIRDRLRTIVEEMMSEPGPYVCDSLII